MTQFGHNKYHPLSAVLALAVIRVTSSSFYARAVSQYVGDLKVPIWSVFYNCSTVLVGRYSHDKNGRASCRERV